MKLYEDISTDIEKRVSTSLAVGRYLRASERFNEASSEFTSACKSLRQELGRDQRFVACIEHKHYLVTTDAEGNFDVDLVELV